jgi:hypothetical protein
MLFLAVFCGFLAEYQLEHRIEKERAKQYIRSFYEDLKADTAEFSRLINIYSASAAVLEKRKDCYESIQKNKDSDDCLVDLFDNSSGFADLITADQTLLQLKNAGGFRLLDKKDTDSILFYDKMVRTYTKEETTGFQQNQYFIRQLIFSLRNYEWVPEQNETTGRPVLFSRNKELLNTYFNALNRYVRVSQRLLSLLLALKQKATDLIQYFNNKYQLK